MTIRLSSRFIEELPENHRVEFRINTCDTSEATIRLIGNYLRMTCDARKLCSARNIEVKEQDIFSIPSTTNAGNPPVFIIHVEGEFEGYYLNISLLAAKNNDYLCAIKVGDNNWRETIGAEYSVQNATELKPAFRGSYVDLPGGIWSARIKFGFKALCRALIGLQKNVNVDSNFMCVVANVFEPTRYIALQNAFIRQMSREFWLGLDSKNFNYNSRRLANGWSYFSRTVLRYRRNNIWTFAWDDSRIGDDIEGNEDEEKKWPRQKRRNDFDIEETNPELNHKVRLEKAPMIIGLLISTERH